MRKDVKLGFAIGGVLLAVAIVFALVHSSRPKTDEVVYDTAGPVQLDGAVAEAGKADANKSADVKPGTTADAAKATDAAKTDAAKAGESPVFNNQTANNNNGGSFDWDATLKTGTPVMAATEKSTLPTPAAPATSDTNTAGRNALPTSVNTTTPPPAEPTRINAPGVSFNYANAPAEPDADDSLKTVGAVVQTPPTIQSAAPGSIRAATKHTIKRGETFSTIAAVYYGNSRYHKVIAAANPKVDPQLLKIGDVITLPALDTKADATKANRPLALAEKPIDAKSHYRVQAGDNLHHICMKLYGDAKNVDAIYTLNKAAIGSDPAKLKLGMVLTLPSAPTASASR